MKKNILKKINPPSFDSFLRNLRVFLLFESGIFWKTSKMCNFCRRLRFKKNNVEKNIFYYFYVMVDFIFYR